VVEGVAKGGGVDGRIEAAQPGDGVVAGSHARMLGPR
jgi:hypothetical protein